ncbi:hypothetical protein PCASD_00057 [Puccinia coronata f. sp. avenae]|uniref:Uncharacterized protein n=1 Tax=Puccinia coronata f. sp. avenae TaxID=200324 RepID=A0A2N5VQK3_9BASI|nr:hypothetical protein PCASD_00057 [Puccinia coronata f. sp. avenae]
MSRRFTLRNSLHSKGGREDSPHTYLIAFVEFAERFSYYGTTVVFTNYMFVKFLRRFVFLFLRSPYEHSHQSISTTTSGGSTTGAGGVQAGALGMGQQHHGNYNVVLTFALLSSMHLKRLMAARVFCAYVADTHLGRYNTILVSIFIALVGHTLLVISAFPPGDRQHEWLQIMGIGTGGFKPNISPLVAEQAETESSTPYIKVHPKSNEKVIVDPGLTASRIYMYFYLIINVGALTGQIGMVYAEKYVGFWLAYLLPTILFCTCPLVMVLGKPLYVLRPPTGSVFR